MSVVFYTLGIVSLEFAPFNPSRLLPIALACFLTGYLMRRYERDV